MEFVFDTCHVVRPKKMAIPRIDDMYISQRRITMNRKLQMRGNSNQEKRKKRQTVKSKKAKCKLENSTGEDVCAEEKELQQ